MGKQEHWSRNHNGTGEGINRGTLMGMKRVRASNGRRVLVIEKGSGRQW